jgi:pilus assembly protein Flp/PilA
VLVSTCDHCPDVDGAIGTPRALWCCPFWACVPESADESFVVSAFERCVMKKQLMALIRGEEGASLVEYGLLVGLIAIACIAAIQVLGGKISDMFNFIATKMVTS